MKFYSICLTSGLLLSLLGCGQVIAPENDALRTESLTEFFKAADLNNDGTLNVLEI